MARFDGDRDLDEVARRLASTLERSGISLSRIPFPQRGDPFDGAKADVVRHDVNLLCLEPDEISGFAFYVPARFFEERTTIAVSLDEDVEHARLAYVDEVWTPGDFGSDLSPPEWTPRGQALWDLPEGGFALAIVDLDDALSLIGSFSAASIPGRALVLRVRTEEPEDDELEHLRSAASDHPDVRVIAGPLSSTERLALLEQCDFYVVPVGGGFDLSAFDARRLGKTLLDPAGARVDAALLDPAPPDEHPAIVHRLALVRK